MGKLLQGTVALASNTGRAAAMARRRTEPGCGSTGGDRSSGARTHRARPASSAAVDLDPFHVAVIRTVQEVALDFRQPSDRIVLARVVAG
jgi:hypothetical protein